MLYIVIQSLVLVGVFTLSALGLEPTKSLRQYVLRTWTTEQGLPQNSINAMLQTHDGLLWIGTQGGLARFDGASFTLYKTGASDSIPGDSITGLAEDRAGGLWISSDGGLVLYRGGRFSTYTRENGLPSNSIWRITADPVGGVWAVTRRSELFHFDGRRVRRYQAPFEERPQEVNALVQAGQGALWIATFHGLFRLDREGGLKRFGHEDGLAGDRVYALALNRQGQLWAAGDGGLTRVLPGHFSSMAIPELGTATLLAFDSSSEDDTIWTGSTGQGLFRLNSRGVQRLRAAEGLISDDLYMLYCSRDGSLWLGALDGLNELSDGAVTSYSIGEGLPRSTHGMQRAQGPGDELWFGYSSLAYHVQDTRLVPLHPSLNAVPTSDPKHTATQNRVQGLESVSVWVRSAHSESRGLVFTDKVGQSVLSNGITQQRLPLIPWSSVGSMLIDRDGTIWTSGSDIGVVAYPVHGPPHAYTATDGLDSNNVLALALDAAGNVWVGTLSGLSRIRHGIVTHVVSCTNVTSIDPAGDGSLWVSSESGLIYVPPALAPVRVFAQRDGLPTSVIEGVVQDTEGHLWLGTEQGIVRINRADLLAPQSHLQSAPVVFGANDGLRNAQLRANSVFRSHHGDIWFVTLQEVAMIDPRRTQIKDLAPILLDGMAIDDQHNAQTSGQFLVVPAGRHRLTIPYTLPEFRIPNRIHFRYRLEGWDKSWIDAGTLRNATYTGIPPGRYTFHVDHSDGYGNWSSTESTLSIRVMPYFYETGWFFTLVAIFATAFVWQMHRLRVVQLSARIDVRMQERTRIARELHDTLLQGVLGVSMQMYAASQQALINNSLASMLGHASQRLREIAEQSRRAVDDLRAPSSSLHSLDTALALLLRNMDLPATILCQIHSVGTCRGLLSPIQLEIEQITREALTNAIQHSRASTIRLDILYHPDHLFVSVSDDGRGIGTELKASVPKSHWGILGMQERAKSVGGRLRILPNVPHGTVVEFSLRGSLAYLQSSRKHTTSSRHLAR